MKSVGQKIQQLEGLLGTTDVTAWEGEFIAGIVERTENGAKTTRLSERQVDVIDKIYDKHFA